jgi:hypothetical protein
MLNYQRVYHLSGFWRGKKSGENQAPVLELLFFPSKIWFSWTGSMRNPEFSDPLGQLTDIAKTHDPLDHSGLWTPCSLCVEMCIAALFFLCAPERRVWTCLRYVQNLRSTWSRLADFEHVWTLSAMKQCWPTLIWEVHCMNKHLEEPEFKN